MLERASLLKPSTSGESFVRSLVSFAFRRRSFPTGESQILLYFQSSSSPVTNFFMIRFRTRSNHLTAYCPTLYRVRRGGEFSDSQTRIKPSCRTSTNFPPAGKKLSPLPAFADSLSHQLRTLLSSIFRARQADAIAFSTLHGQPTRDNPQRARER